MRALPKLGVKTLSFPSVQCTRVEDTGGWRPSAPARMRSMGRGYARDFLENWRRHEGPLRRKLLVALRNRAIATSLVRGGCCGHHGEPGC